MGYSSTCGKLKNQQTNAVIYRTDRFTYEETTRWRSDAPDNWDKGTGACKNLDDTPTSQDRVENVAVRLYDRIAKQRVSVASIHWPTDTWHGTECAAENMREANDAVDGLGGTLKIVAGDANTTKGTEGWWKDALGYGFRDPIAETCPSSGCPDSTSTVGSRRIDFMLVKGGHGFSGARTISEKSTGGTYSNHRALRANVYY
jgi:endonuclease/exonuclease/phosphatase family metal-dependent hydrolase